MEVVVEDWFLEHQLLSEIQFADTTVWSISDILEKLDNDNDSDLNGDGISNIVAYLGGISIHNTDFDQDGLSNAIERGLGLNFYNADTDGDGVLDSEDGDPLDPSVFEQVVFDLDEP